MRNLTVIILALLCGCGSGGYSKNDRISNVQQVFYNTNDSYTIWYREGDELLNRSLNGHVTIKIDATDEMWADISEWYATGGGRNRDELYSHRSVIHIRGISDLSGGKYNESTGKTHVERTQQPLIK